MDAFLRPIRPYSNLMLIMTITFAFIKPFFEKASTSVIYLIV